MELLVVISIVSIFISTAYFRNSRIMAFNVAAEYDITNVRTFMEAEYLDSRLYPTPARDTATGRLALYILKLIVCPF